MSGKTVNQQIQASITKEGCSFSLEDKINRQLKDQIQQAAPLIKRINDFIGDGKSRSIDTLISRNLLVRLKDRLDEKILKYYQNLFEKHAKSLELDSVETELTINSDGFGSVDISINPYLTNMVYCWMASPLEFLEGKIPFKDACAYILVGLAVSCDLITAYDYVSNTSMEALNMFREGKYREEITAAISKRKDKIYHEQLDAILDIANIIIHGGCSYSQMREVSLNTVGPEERTIAECLLLLYNDYGTPILMDRVNRLIQKSCEISKKKSKLRALIKKSSDKDFRKDMLSCDIYSVGEVSPYVSLGCAFDFCREEFDGLFEGMETNDPFTAYISVPFESIFTENSVEEEIEAELGNIKKLIKAYDLIKKHY